LSVTLVPCGNLMLSGPEGNVIGKLTQWFRPRFIRINHYHKNCARNFSWHKFIFFNLTWMSGLVCVHFD
jgi:hypothetical protein